jgi:hypothetical protein
MASEFRDNIVTRQIARAAQNPSTTPQYIAWLKSFDYKLECGHEYSVYNPGDGYGRILQDIEHDLTTLRVHDRLSNSSNRMLYMILEATRMDRLLAAKGFDDETRDAMIYPAIKGKFQEKHDRVDTETYILALRKLKAFYLEITQMTPEFQRMNNEQLKQVLEPIDRAINNALSK